MNDCFDSIRGFNLDLSKDARIFIVDSKRTAIGKFLGSLYEADPCDVSVQVIKKGFRNELLKDVESVIIGNAIQAGMGQGIARKIAINADIPERVPAYTVGMVCGSGMQAIRNAVNEIKCGGQLIMCGGLEFMSNIPFATDSYIRLGKKFGNFNMVDLMTHDGLLDSFSGVHMGITAENVAKKYNITREMQDEYSYMTLQRAIKAVDSGVFKDEIVSVTLRDYKNRKYVFDTDEFPNRISTPEKMASLEPTFVKDGSGTVTAASASGINDGACFMLLASESYCRQHNLTAIAEIVDTVAVGCDPQYMGLGPYYAISKLLDNNHITVDDIDFFEINEAFASQVIACEKLLAEKYQTSVEAIRKKSNIYGSGLGLGHPLGMTGARITGTLAHIMNNHSCEYGVASLCIGGGMGAAVLLRKVRSK